MAKSDKKKKKKGKDKAKVKPPVAKKPRKKTSKPTPKKESAMKRGAPRNALEQEVADTIEQRITRMGKARKDPQLFGRELGGILEEYRKSPTMALYVPGMDPPAATPNYPYPWIRPYYTDSAEKGEVLIIMFSDALMKRKENMILARFAMYER